MSGEIIVGAGGTPPPPPPPPISTTEGYTFVQMVQRVREVLRPESLKLDVPSLGNHGWTLAQMRDRVREVLRDESKDFISDDDIRDLLNEAFLDLGNRTRTVRNQQTGTVSTIGQAVLSAEVIEPIWMEVGNQPVEFVGEETWYDWNRTAQTPPRILGRVFGQAIELYPLNAGASFTIRYVGRPNVVTADADMTNIPMSLQSKAVNYARYHCMVKSGQLGQAEHYLGAYTEGLPPLVETATGGEPGPAQAQPAAQGPVRTVSDNEIKDFLNEGLIEVASRARQFRTRVTGTTTAAYISPPERVVQVYSLRLGTDDVQFVPQDEFYNWSDSEAVPSRTIAYLWDGRIYLYPVPVSGTAYQLDYHALPAPLVNPTDVPNLPVELQMNVINYARSHALLVQGESTSHERYFGLYMEGLPSARVDRYQTGPIQLIPEAGAFDTYDAAHF